MEWRFSYLTESDHKPNWFAGEPFLLAIKMLHESGMVEYLTDRDSALIVADQFEENGRKIEANAIREFLQADGPLQMLRDQNSVSRPT